MNRFTMGMINKSISIISALLLLSTMTQQVSAIPRTWYLHDVVFDDNTTATGSFDFDNEADTNKYSNIDITTENGQYTELFTGSDSNKLRTADLASLQFVQLKFESALPSNGGTVAITNSTSSFEGPCNTDTCSQRQRQRLVMSGSVMADVADTPMPSAMPSAMPTSTPSMADTPMPSAMPSAMPTSTPSMTPRPTTTPSPSTTPQNLTWYLQNVTFDDNATATGSFDYDARTNTYFNINITTEASEIGEAVGAEYGDPVDSFLPVGPTFFRTIRDSMPQNLRNETWLQLVFESALTSSGGTVMIRSNYIGSSERFCARNDCTGSYSTREVASGYVTTDPVVPTAMPTSMMPTQPPASTVFPTTPTPSQPDDSSDTGQCLIKKCCEQTCCGEGTKWDSRLGCVKDDSSTGWKGPYTGLDGCEVWLCCEAFCCHRRIGTVYDPTKSACVPID